MTVALALGFAVVTTHQAAMWIDAGVAGLEIAQAHRRDDAAGGDVD